MRPVRKDVLFDERHRLHHRRTTLDTVVALSVEGVSISAVSRVEDISWSTVARCLERAAQVCRRFNRETIAGFAVTELQADEIRTFTGGKTRPTWTFGAIEVWSRLWPSTVTGRRSYWNTLAFIRDVSMRMNFAKLPLIVTEDSISTRRSFARSSGQRVSTGRSSRREGRPRREG